MKKRKLPEEDLDKVLTAFEVPLEAKEVMVTTALLRELIQIGFRIGLDAEVMKAANKPDERRT